MFHLPGIETESQKMLKGLGNITRQEEREDAAMDPSLHHLDHDGQIRPSTRLCKQLFDSLAGLRAINVTQK